jgi:hypothetical protein
MITKTSRLVIVLAAIGILGLVLIPAQAGSSKNIKAAISKIPVPVRNTIQEQAGTVNIANLDKISFRRLDVFEVEWIANNADITIYVAKDGELLYKKVEGNIIDPNNFVSEIDNQYFPLKPGTTFFYRGKSGSDVITDEVYVTHQTKEIIDVNTTVVRDRVFVNDVLSEETFDWYAQDEDGNVWYFGEDSKEFDANGVVISTEGSWEAGVNGARPGIIMEADPQKGDVYRQEFAAGVAEDMAKVLGLNQTVTVPYGTFHNCLKTKDFSLLEPDVTENKFYAPEVGFILSKMVKGGSEKLELINITTE